MKKDSIASSDDLGSPLFDHARKNTMIYLQVLMANLLLRLQSRSSPRLLQASTNGNPKKLKMKRASSEYALIPLKKLTDIFAPNDNVKNAEPQVLAEIVAAESSAIYSRSSLFCNLTLDQKMKTPSSIYPTRALTVLVKMMEHKDFVKSIGVQSLKMLIGLTVQSLVDARLEVQLH